MKTQTQETANTHSEAADNFNCLADELILFTEEQVRLAQTVSTSISQTINTPIVMLIYHLGTGRALPTATV